MLVTSDVGFVPSVTTQTKSFFRLSGHEKTNRASISLPIRQACFLGRTCNHNQY